MTCLDIEDVKIRLAELIDRVVEGEEIVITIDGRAVAALVPHKARRDYWSIYGAWKGKVDMSRFDEADEEIARAFGMADEALAR